MRFHLEKSTLYNMKKLIELQGSHDEFYGRLLAYNKIVKATNPDSVLQYCLEGDCEEKG